jgi:hypothetical protein
MLHVRKCNGNIQSSLSRHCHEMLLKREYIQCNQVAWCNRARHNHGDRNAFSKIYQEGGRVILKHDKRGMIVMQIGHVLVVRL